MSSGEDDRRLADAIGRHKGLSVAVSGGVDSLTLATFAHRFGQAELCVIHAASPAVPPSATDRVHACAKAEGWHLIVTGAGEFDDVRYRDNPFDRCYFCKTNLYKRIRELTPYVIASGANLDDLGDYRPGLLAAAEHEVVHPFIESGMNKGAIRALARRQGLDDISDLPAQPCLASRVETGIAIDAGDLFFVDMVETRLARVLPSNSTLRCRITHAGVVIEVGQEVEDFVVLNEIAGALCKENGRSLIGIARYRRGSMFVRG
jgi:pyridinium-3,5-biscarboxylic acid mononucleotide sulfurtransferase